MITLPANFSTRLQDDWLNPVALVEIGGDEELVTDPTFANWTGGTPDEWVEVVGGDGDAAEDANGVAMTGTGAGDDVSLTSVDAFAASGQCYRVTITVRTYTSGTLKVYLGATAVAANKVSTITAAGTYEVIVRPNSTGNLYLQCEDGCDLIVSLASVSPVFAWTTRSLLSGAQNLPAGFDATYAPVITSISGLENELADTRIGQALRGSVTVSILNSDTDVRELLGTAGYPEMLENRMVKIRIGFSTDGADSAFATGDFITLFTGRVEDYKGDTELSVQVYDMTTLRHRQLPARRITEDDPIAHEDILGDWYPILYGDAAYALGLQWNTNLGLQSIVFNGIGYSNIGLEVTPVADLDVKVWDDKLKTWLTVAHVDDENNAGSEEYTSSAYGVSFDDGTNPYAERGMMHFAHMIVPSETIEVRAVGDASVANPENVFDGDVNTYARFNVYNHSLIGGGILDEAEFWPRSAAFMGFDGGAFAAYKITSPQLIGSIVSIYLLAKIDLPANWSDSTTKYVFAQAQPRRFNQADRSYVGGFYSGSYGTPTSELIPFGGDYNNYPGGGGAGGVGDNEITHWFGPREYKSDGTVEREVRWPTSDTSELKGTQEARIIVGGYWSAQNNQDFEFDCYAIGLFLNAEVSFEEVPRLCAAINGRIYDTTWPDADGTDRKTASDAVVGGADIFEALLRHELELTTDEIDTDSFDATDSLLATAPAVVDIYEEIESADQFKQLCEAHAFRWFKRSDGRESISQITGVALTADADLNESDYIVETMEIGRTDMSLIENDFLVRYGWQPIADRWTGFRYVDADGHNWTALANQAGAAQTKCSNSVSRWGIRRRRVIENRAIETLNHAELLLDRMINIERVVHRHWTAEFNAVWTNSFALEVGDIISLDGDKIPSAVRGVGKRWEVVRVGYNELTDAEVTIKAVSLDADD